MKSRVSRGRVPATKEETMGYLRGVVHGAIIGGAVALLYAPKPGRQMRGGVLERLGQGRGPMEPGVGPGPGGGGLAPPPGGGRNFKGPPVNRLGTWRKTARS